MINFQKVAKRTNELGLLQSWFPYIDGEENIYELERCDFQGFKSKLVLNSPIKVSFLNFKKANKDANCSVACM